jgi:hypothetical protein
LARGAGGFADDAKSAAADEIRRKSEIDHVEDIEKLGAELEGPQLRVSAMAKGCVFDQSHIEIAKTGAAESVATKRAEAAMIRSGAAGNVNRDTRPMPKSPKPGPGGRARLACGAVSRRESA